MSFAENARTVEENLTEIEYSLNIVKETVKNKP